MKNLFYVYDCNGNGFGRVRQQDGTTTHEAFFVPTKWWPHADGHFYPQQEAQMLALATGGTIAPVSLRAQKQELLSEISDRSKEVNGFRLRLDADSHTLARLEEIRDSLVAEQEWDAAERNRVAHSKMLEANHRKDERRQFNQNFGAMANAFGAL
jgi:hypothetical protein